jgi:antitoxin HigA-1
MQNRVSSRKEKMAKTRKLMPPVRSCKILLEDFREPLGLSVHYRALKLHVSSTRLGEHVHQCRRVAADTALCLARYFKTDSEFWLNLQNFYELGLSRRSGSLSEIASGVHPAAELVF